MEWDADKVVVIGLVVLIAALLSIPDWQSLQDTFVQTLTYQVYGDYRR